MAWLLVYPCLRRHAMFIVGVLQAPCSDVQEYDAKVLQYTG